MFAPILRNEMFRISEFPLEQRQAAAEQSKSRLSQMGVDDELLNNFDTTDLSDQTLDAAILTMNDFVKLSEEREQTRDTRTPNQKEFEQFESMPEGVEKEQFGRMIGAIDPPKNTTTEAERLIDLLPKHKRQEAIERATGVRPSIDVEAKAKAEEKQRQFETETRKRKGRERAVTVRTAINDAMELADGFFEEGLFGKGLSFISGTDAHALDSKLETIRANTGLNELRAIKESTGAGLGSVSEAEHKLLQAVVGTLKVGLDGDALMGNLMTYQVLYDAIVNESMAIPLTNEDFDSIPSGSMFISPDTGKPMRKMVSETGIPTSTEVNPSDVMLQMRRREDRFKKENRMPDSSSVGQEFEFNGIKYTVEED